MTIMTRLMPSMTGRTDTFRLINASSFSPIRLLFGHKVTSVSDIAHHNAAVTGCSPSFQSSACIALLLSPAKNIALRIRVAASIFVARKKTQATMTDDQKKELTEVEKKGTKPKGKDEPAAATAGQPKDPAK